MVGEAQAETLAQGVFILCEVLGPHGFVFEPGGQGKGSGGPAAWGSFVRGSQRIELHFRHSLGLVSYTWDDTVLSHGDYLDGLGIHGSYPGFSDDPLDGFRHMAADLSGPLAEFVTGDHSSFVRVAEVAQALPTKRLP